MKPYRLAIFADSATPWLVQAIERCAMQMDFPIEIKAWAFTSPLAEQAALQAFAPDSILYWVCAQQARTRALPDLQPFATLPYQWIIPNMPILDDGCFGSYALQAPQSLRARLLQWNLNLLNLATTQSNLSLLDLEAIVARLGHATAFDARLWEATMMALSPTAYECFAKRLLAQLKMRQGAVKKVLVTDLDDTLWTGIVSDLGPEAIDPQGPGRAAYHAWLKTLAERGILLAIASRNDKTTVQAAFKRTDLPFTLEDFSAVEVSWDKPKSAMLQSIAEALGVLPESLVFIDDRPENRAEVREHLPGVEVPELHEDPAYWMDALSALTCFETQALTAEDSLRAASLRANAARQTMAEQLSPEAYLATLEQELTAQPLAPEHFQRAAQLTQRCNRFNMCASRLTLDDLKDAKGWVYTLKDKYGDLGMISLVLLSGSEITTWVLSCRAFGRNVENLILDHLRANVPNLCGRYTPTDRNTICANLYQEKGIPTP